MNEFRTVGSGLKHRPHTEAYILDIEFGSHKDANNKSKGESNVTSCLFIIKKKRERETRYLYSFIYISI